MKETTCLERQIWLRQDTINLMDWCFLLMPFVAVLEVFEAWLVFGARDVSYGMILTIWSSVYFLGNIGRMCVCGLRHVYGYKRLSVLTRYECLCACIAVVAMVCCVANVIICNVALGWYWRMQIIGAFVLVLVLTGVLLVRFFRDLQDWRQSGFDGKFYEYVAAMQANEADDVDESRADLSARS